MSIFLLAVIVGVLVVMGVVAGAVALFMRRS
jgi:hypothetical protein